MRHRVPNAGKPNTVCVVRPTPAAELKGSLSEPEKVTHVTGKPTSPAEAISPLVAKPPATSEPDGSKIVPIGRSVTLRDGSSVTDTEIHSLLTDPTRGIRISQKSRHVLISFRLLITRGETLTPAQLDYLSSLMGQCRHKRPSAKELETSATVRTNGNALLAIWKKEATSDDLDIIFTAPLILRVRKELNDLLAGRIDNTEMQVDSIVAFSLSDGSARLFNLLMREARSARTLIRHFFFNPPNQELIIGDLRGHLTNLPRLLRAELESYPSGKMDAEELEERVNFAMDTAFGTDGLGTGKNHEGPRFVSGGAPGSGKGGTHR